MKICLTYLCNTFHVPYSNDSLVITKKKKKAQLKKLLCNLHVILHSKKPLPPQTLVNISGTSVTPRTEVCLYVNEMA